MKTKELPSNIEGVKKEHGRRKKHITLASLFALLVVICTVCALVIPASTLEATASLPEGAQVPDGYTQQYTVEDEENGFTVTVYAAEGVLPEGAQLSAQLLSEEDDAYTQAEEALALDAESGFAALDISFAGEDGSELEPDGDVYVVINAQGLLPEDADADTVTVQHHAEGEDGITVETVADTAEDTQGVVAVADESIVQAAFSVSSFSTFTISWSDNSAVTLADTVDTVETADTSATVSISLYNYTEQINDSGTDASNFMFAGGTTGFRDGAYWWNYWTQSGGGVTQGIVESVLTNGYPTLTDGVTILVNGSTTSSLESLFSDAGNEQVTAYEGLNHLFIYDEETGYYSFDSSKNFATIYNSDGTYSSNFTVYDAANTGTSTGTTGHPYFLPFNAYGTSESSADYHFGMKITMEFMMPADGQVNGNDMIFEFAGDDDMWLYIDGVLILDMGGIHDSNTGRINFREGTVTVDQVYSIGGTTNGNESQTLYIGDLLYEAYQDDSSYISTNLTYNEANGHWYLNDYTSHDLAFFYLERGAVDSNCEITFNLYTLHQNSLTVGKELSTTGSATEEIDEWLGDLEYTFRVLNEDADPDTTEDDDLFISGGTTYDIYNSSNQKIGEGTVAEDGTFTLKAGQYAVFKEIEEDEGSYYVQELVESEYAAQFGSVSVSVSPSAGSSGLTDENGVTIEEQEFSGVISGVMDASSTGYVVFTNNVDTEKLSTLTITKQAGSGSVFSEDDTFTVYVEIDGEPLNGTYSGVTFEDGEGTFSVGTTVSIPVLAGAEFTIYEVDGETYNVVYSAEQTFADADTGGSYTLTENEDDYGSVSGTVGDLANTSLPEGDTVTDATSATMTVTLTNYSESPVSLTIVKNIYGLSRSQVVGLINGAYRTDGGLKFDVDYFSTKEAAQIDDYKGDDFAGDWTFSAEQTLTTDTGDFLDGETWAGEIQTGDKDITETELAHYSSSSLTEMKDADGTTYYQYTITISGMELNDWYHVWETHVDVTGYTLTSSVVATDAEGNVLQNLDTDTHTNRATVFQLTGDTTVTFTNKYTTSLTVHKTDSVNNTALADAGFRLYYQDDDGTTYYYYYDEENSCAGWTTTETDADTVYSDSDGNLTFYDLAFADIDTFYLEETVAPDGYQRLEHEYVIHLNEDGGLEDGDLTVYYNSTPVTVKLNEDGGGFVITVQNQTGQELPATGGTGTAIYTIGGAALMLAAAAIGIYSMKRKRRAQ